MNTKKEKKKKRVYFSMDEQILVQFEEYIEKNLISQSAVLEKLVEDFLKNNKTNNVRI